MLRKFVGVAATAAAVLLTASTAHAAPHCDTRGAAGLAYEVGVNCRTVAVDGIDRRYVVYIPDRRPVTGDRAPVVFMFHGTSGTGEQFLRRSGWREVADDNGFAVVFPTALRYRVLESGRRVTKWNGFGLEDAIDLEERPPGYPEDAPMPADDVGFVDEIVNDLLAQLPIDRNRIYASGFSNGADFAARLSVERSTKIAAAAYSAGTLTDATHPDRPVPTYFTLGTRDDHILEGTGLTELPLNPVDILASPIVGPVLDANLATWGLDPDRFGAIARRKSTLLRWPPTGTDRNGALFQFRMIAGLRHKFPRDGNNPAGFEAAPEFWEFFEEHPLLR
jgi:poly(3-hydroxybutyrate) depolymerase